MNIFSATGIFQLAVLFFSLLSFQLYATDQNLKSPSCNHQLTEAPPYSKACSTKWDVFANVFYWCAQESGADIIATKQLTGGVPALTPAPPNGEKTFQFYEPSFNWDFGFRAGLGYQMEHDQWDVQLYYTWFRTEAKGHLGTSEGESLLSSFFGSFFAVTALFPYTSTDFKWNLLLNMFDWELGRNCVFSQALLLRPFLGLKGGWIHQNVYTQWQALSFSATENLKNHFYGIGPSAGVDSQWKFLNLKNHCLSLLGDFSLALMWGYWSFNDVYTKSASPQNFTVGLQNDDGAAPFFQTFMGIGWDSKLKNDHLHFAIRLGYEMEFWVDQLQFVSYDMGRLNGILTLQGGVLDFRFDF